MGRFPKLLTLLVIGLALAAGVYFLVHSFREAWQEREIAALAEKIFRSPTSFVAGNPQGDVSVVAFFDYNCPFCRQGAPDLAKLIQSDDKVRLVLKELPVLGKESEDVSRIALAAGHQGKYLGFYQSMIATVGRATKAKALRVVSELGLDADRLEAEMDDPSITATLLENARLGRDIGVRGVPFYLVGDRSVGEGEDLYGRLVERVADVRANGCRKAAC